MHRSSKESEVVSKRTPDNQMAAAAIPMLEVRQLALGAMRLSGGTAVGHTITLLATPFLAKLYGPESFGIWAGWLALAGVIGTVACLRYDTAIALPDNDRNALHVAAVAILLATLIAAASGMLLWGVTLLEVGGPWEQLGEHVAWVPVGAVVIAWVGVATQWLARVQEVATLAKAKIWSSAVTVGVQIALGWSAGAGGLILGDILGRSAGLWGRIQEVWRSQASNIAEIRGKNLGEALRHYRVHSGWMTPTAMIDVLGQQAPLLLILNWYGGSIGGQFSLAQRLLALPATLLGQSVAQLLLPAMAKAHRASPHTALRLFLGLSGILVLASAALIGAVWHLEEGWLVALLGIEWQGIGGFLPPLSILVGVQLLASTLSQTAVVLGVQKWYALWVVLWVAASVGGMWVGHNWGGLEATVWGLLTGSGTLYVFLWVGLLFRLIWSRGKNVSS